MAREFHIEVDDHGLTRRIEIFTRREIVKAQRKGLTEAVKLGRMIARSQAPRRTGKGRRAIIYQTRSRRGFLTGRVYVKRDGFYMRFLARGTGERHTRRGFNRGHLEAVPFMQNAANEIDPRVHGFIDEAVRHALRTSRLE